MRTIWALMLGIFKAGRRMFLVTVRGTRGAEVANVAEQVLQSPLLVDVLHHQQPHGFGDCAQSVILSRLRSKPNLNLRVRTEPAVL